jgi:Flp pilus assembly protein TadB
MTVQALHETVAAMIAPALFLTATGSLLISTAARIARIVDRIRTVVNRCESGELEQLDFPEERRRHAIEELRHLHTRSNRVSAAVTMLYMAFGAFVMTSMAIAIDSFTGHHIAILPVLFAVAGVGLLLVACVYLVLEARSSLKGNDREVQFFHELEALRKQARQTSSPSGDKARKEEPSDATT